MKTNHHCGFNIKINIQHDQQQTQNLDKDEEQTETNHQKIRMFNTKQKTEPMSISQCLTSSNKK